MGLLHDATRAWSVAAGPAGAAFSDRTS